MTKGKAAASVVAFQISWVFTVLLKHYYLAAAFSTTAALFIVVKAWNSVQCKVIMLIPAAIINSYTHQQYD